MAAHIYYYLLKFLIWQLILLEVQINLNKIYKGLDGTPFLIKKVFTDTGNKTAY